MDADIPMAWTKRKFRTPRTNDTLMAVPPLDQVPAAVASNRARPPARQLILGAALEDLRSRARREILGLLSPGQTNADGPWVLTGHQPALYHPGVWVKNFAASSVARRAGGVSLNLVVDNDVLAVPGIRVPIGPATAPAQELFLFDDPRPAQPWEESRLLNPDLARSFANRVTAAMAPWQIEPLVGGFWSKVQAALQKSPRLVPAITAARSQLEHAWGFGNLELPISCMAQTDAFRWFTCDLLARLPQFHALHNAVLADYRRVNRVRSRTHPVPDLKTSDLGIEAPFWVWREGETRRRRVHARIRGDVIELSDGRELIAPLPLSPTGSPEAAIAVLRDLAAAGWKIRPRALTTTLFARLFVADLFVHGIGGAKYDEMTDQLIARFYGSDVPAFLTLTATLHLPFAGETLPTTDLPGMQCRLRRMRFQPEKFLSPTDSASSAIRDVLAEKERWIAEQQRVAHARRTGEETPTAGRRRAERLRELTAGLAEFTVVQRDELRLTIAEASRQSRTQSIFRNREFAFCLFPEPLLRSTFQRWFA